MRLNGADRDNLRNSFKILIPKTKRSEIVHHFEKEENAWRTIYKTKDRMQNKGSIKDRNKSGRLTTCSKQPTENTGQ